MSAKPILFSGSMIRAILAGTKSQTRRLVRYTAGGHVQRGKLRWHPDDPEAVKACQYGGVGGLMWVRETFHACPHCHDGDAGIAYRAGGWMCPPSGAPDDGGDRNDTDDRPLNPKCAAHGWRPSIFMPRRFSRITLEITAIRIERLQNITAEDIIAEGAVERAHADQDLGLCPVSAFDGKAYLDLLSLWVAGWDTLNKKRAPWSSNPRVWVRTFQRVA